MRQFINMNYFFYSISRLHRICCHGFYTKGLPSSKKFYFKSCSIGMNHHHSPDITVERPIIVVRNLCLESIFIVLDRFEYNVVFTQYQPCIIIFLFNFFCLPYIITVCNYTARHILFPVREMISVISSSACASCRCIPFRI